MTHILKYQFHADYLNLRTPHRIDHFDYIKAYIDNNRLILGGATEADPPEGIIIFHKMEKEEIQDFAEHDPYVKNGVVVSYQIVKWNVIAGGLIDNLNIV